VAILRVDYGGRGGFERHLDTVAAELTDRGWIVESIAIDGTSPASRLFGLDIKPVQYEFHDDYFKYLSLVAQVSELDLSRFDVVLTSQPPTYLAPHPNKVALFYHQARQFYDLAEPYVLSGFADPHMHHEAIESVHRVDVAAVGDVRRWLAGSATTAERLGHYWGIPANRIELYRAGPDCQIPDQPPHYQPGGPILHVGRFEWPKRAELLVEAVHRIGADRTALFVGTGSRLEFVRSLDATLGQGRNAGGAELLDGSGSRSGSTLDLTDQPTASWLNRGIFTAGWAPDLGPPSGRIRFAGAVGDAERDQAYAAASVVVAPALNEDYGLTAIEAMAHARPVVVCSDGGGLTELVQHEQTGLIADPEPEAVAEAIDRLLADQPLAERLGQAGHRLVRDRDHGAATAQIEAALLEASADRSQLQLL
jgi:glycosyltransferase involved in cell wall biosynthesis